MTHSLQNQVAIVTGGATGIGGATARRLAAEGATVLIADADSTTAQANVERIQQAGGTAAAIEIDLTRSDDIALMVENAVERWGRLDILINNAWGSKERDGSAVTLSESAWDRAMTLGVKALFLGAKHAVPHMQKNRRGSIINIASVHGLLMAPHSLAYEAAKSAVIGITRQMAIDFGPLGIRVNSISPGHILSESMQRRWANHPSHFPLFEAQYPLRRVGQPDDIANAIRFLCSDEASFITGHNLVVDGGLTIQLQENHSLHVARFYRDHPDIILPQPRG